MVQNLKDLMVKFSDEQACRDFLVQQRWNGCPVCPYCGSTKWYRIENGKRFKCGNSECYKKYSVTVGTVFHATNIPLTTWFPAMYILSAHKKGISSVQLAKDLGVTQKTAWFMMHRIRESLKDNGSSLLGGTVETDETYVGGKLKNKHKKYRKDNINKSNDNKTTVMAFISREQGIKVQVLDNRQEIMQSVRDNVSTDARLITDEAGAYHHANKEYANHEVVHHSQNEFVRGDIHTNTVEGFFSHLKRKIYGIHHFVTAKHLQRYADETAYKYNLRDMNDGERFTFALSHIEGGLTYKQLVYGKDNKDSQTKENKG